MRTRSITQQQEQVADPIVEVCKRSLLLIVRYTDPQSFEPTAAKSRSRKRR